MSETVYAGAPFTGSLDSSTCSLGKWLNSDEVKEVHDPEVILLINEISGPHRTIHARAGDIINNISLGETNEAIRMFREEVLPATQEVISNLQKMEDREGVMLNDSIIEIHDLAFMFERIIMVLIVVAFVAGIILALSITTNIVKTIMPFSAFMEKVGTTGNIVLTPEEEQAMQKDLRRKDELGMMIRSFGTLLGKIKEMVINIKKEVMELSKIGNELASDMTETAAGVNEINSTIQSLKQRIISQSASVSETHATMEQVVGNIEKLNSHVDDQTSHISQASSA
ncbi:MAG: hypothetical protein LBH42_09575, partial [Treponema sp.]|nr:hypothetical protein [Treponema sp.]